MSLDFLYYPIAFVMKLWHSALSYVIDPDSGLAWALSIVLLVITVRIILFPLFTKQVRSQRAMNEIQPELMALRKEYGKDRQGMAEAQQKLFRERGVNPLASCLPLLPQIPVFIALLHVLRRLAPGKPGLYSWDDALTNSAASAKIFGAPISANFGMSGSPLQTLIDNTGTSQQNIRIVAGVLILVMCTTQFISTKQIMKRSGPVEGQAARIQKLMLYGAPFGLLISGFIFPIGVLVYWFTNNLWTIGQQFYAIHKYPTTQQQAYKEQQNKPKADPTLLAPKPGAKPKRSAATTVTAVETGATASADGATTDPPSTGTTTGAATSGNGTSGNGTSGNGASAKGTPAKAGGTPKSGGAGTKPGTAPRPGASPGTPKRGKRKR